MSSYNDLPIGLFDSGVGGLTVLHALKKQLPNENYLYLGDCARLPYGTKGPDTVIRYALQAAKHLVARKIKLLVIACNTATSVSLPHLQAEHPNIPVVGVVEPGARASCEATKTGNIVVAATANTIEGKAYHKAIQTIRPNAQVHGIPCPLFVALAEEGWRDGEIVEGIIKHYLSPLFEKPNHPDCLVLGCTHFPILAESIAKVLGDKVALVDSAKTTAAEVANILDTKQLHRTETAPPWTKFLTTDDPARFCKTGELFLGHSFGCSIVELVDI
ncbi:MAG: glutamate racemase [Desulfovibrio sp.]